MPLLSVTDAGTEIPGSLTKRSQILLRNEGPDDLRFGWEETVTNNATAATDGVLLKVDDPISLGGADLDLRGNLKLICAAGETATVSYTTRG